jgi:anhydro-N-acetylmuramic acid kinase
MLLWVGRVLLWFPLGDLYLFSEYDAALNLGGFSNITLINSSPLRAFDICPVNIVLNDFARREGVEFDRSGQMSSEGIIHEKLLADLEEIQHYQLTLPPSLSREWVEKHMIPLFERFSISAKDFLRTYTEHIAMRIASVLETSGCRNCLVTGGGAFNSFLMSRVGVHTSTELIIPSDMIVQYKEALIFAFLGLKRFRGEVNVLSSITGAKRDSSSGVIWKG